LLDEFIDELIDKDESYLKELMEPLVNYILKEFSMIMVKEVKTVSDNSLEAMLKEVQTSIDKVVKEIQTQNDKTLKEMLKAMRTQNETALNQMKETALTQMKTYNDSVLKEMKSYNDSALKEMKAHAGDSHEVDENISHESDSPPSVPSAAAVQPRSPSKTESPVLSDPRLSRKKNQRKSK